MAIEPPPPGETGRELTGDAAFSAMADALRVIADPPRLTFGQVQDIDVRRVGRWMLVTVKYRGRDTNEVVFRIRRAWATVLWQRLGKVLNA